MEIQGLKVTQLKLTMSEFSAPVDTQLQCIPRKEPENALEEIGRCRLMPFVDGNHEVEYPCLSYLLKILKYQLH